MAKKAYHLWKVKVVDIVAMYVVTSGLDHNEAIVKVVQSYHDNQEAFDGMEPEHPVEKVEYLGTVIT